MSGIAGWQPLTDQWHLSTTQISLLSSLTLAASAARTRRIAPAARTRTSTPYIFLMEACRRLDAELLVLGSRGRGGFSGLLLGSVGQECASHASCAVLICKANGDRPS